MSAPANPMEQFIEEIVAARLAKTQAKVPKAFQLGATFGKFVSVVLTGCILGLAAGLGAAIAVTIFRSLVR